MTVTRLPDKLDNNARVGVALAGTVAGIRRLLNLTSNDGSVTFTATDDGVNEKLTLDMSSPAGAAYWQDASGVLQLDPATTADVLSVLVSPTLGPNTQFALTDDGTNPATGFINSTTNNSTFGISWTGTGAVININGTAQVSISNATGSVTVDVNGVNIDPGSGKYLTLSHLPTSNPGGTGRVWNNSGVLSIT